jgi:hypothetical protein
MRGDKIDITKSKKTGRLIKKTWLIEPIYDFLFYTLIVGIFPFVTGLNLLEEIKSKSNLTEPLILFTLSIIWAIYLFRAVLGLDRLTKIKGEQKDLNREAVKLTAESLNWRLAQHNQQFSILIPPWKLLSTNWGREIVIIYDKQDILINCLTFGLHDLKSPFHRGGNLRMSKQLTEKFKEFLQQLKNDN